MAQILAEKALHEIPRILSLIDKNKFSPTYGCFDRNFWNYKTVDFPSGMAQVALYPLAFVYANSLPNNKYQGKERIKEFIIAGMRYLPKCSHSDGTADEFYPFERALGATAFSLIAAAESYLLIKEPLPDVVAFFKKRADWLLKNSEPNIIANHQAGTALALTRIYQITNEKKYLEGAKKRIMQLTRWWNEEGWFYEYEGCDPGYATFTITFLAKYYEVTKDPIALKYIKKSISFCKHFIGPDGSYGGEYGSRNTAHFYTHGFELSREPEGMQMVDLYLQGLALEKNEFMNDEKYFFYTVMNYLDTYKTYAKERPSPLLFKEKEIYFPKAKLHIAKKGPYFTITSLGKGTIRVYKERKLIYVDAGFIGETQDGTKITSQLIGNEAKENPLTSKGAFSKFSFKLPNTPLMIAFRSMLLLFAWNWTIGSIVKSMLVKILITGKKELPIRFAREFNITNKGILIKNTLESKKKIKSLYIGSDHAVITVPTSKYFQESTFFSWMNLEDEVTKLNEQGSVIFTQNIQ